MAGSVSTTTKRRTGDGRNSEVMSMWQDVTVPFTMSPGHTLIFEGHDYRLAKSELVDFETWDQVRAAIESGQLMEAY